MIKMRDTLPILANLLFLLSACSAPTLPIATVTPAPTVTLTFTPLPTATPTPTATATPLPSPGLHAYSSRVEVVISGSTTVTTTVRYLLYFPADYGKDTAKKWPLILSLHGSGEMGDNLELVKRTGLPEALAQIKDFPFVVVAPQLPAPEIHGDQTYAYSQNDPYAYLLAYGWRQMNDALYALLDQLTTSYAIDDHRIYLTGLSMGGFGTWDLALHSPGRFAAIVPIAGGYYYGDTSAPDDICALKDTPVWAFHGEEDEAVPYTLSQILVDALLACGGATAEAKLTLYPNTGHNGSWQQAYADPTLYQWLLDQSLK